MTNYKYIRLIINKHSVSNLVMNHARSTAKDLYPCIRIWANHILGMIDKDSDIIMNRNYFQGIIPTGSIVKRTNIIGGTDVDLFISLSYRTPCALEDIYDSLSRYLKLLGFFTRDQDVSIGVNYKNLWIDLVPGHKQKGSTNDHSIYRKKTGSWTKTNVNKHVSFVTKSGRRNEIKALKIWRKLHGLEFPSFLIELSVIEALKRKPVGRLSVNLLKVFEYLSSDFIKARIIDPANLNNIVSEDLNDKEKNAIARSALSSRNSAIKSLWEEIIW